MLARGSPFQVALSSTSPRSSTNVAPASGACPVLRTSTRYVTTSPAFTVCLSAVLTISRLVTGVVVEQSGSVDPGGQLPPGVSEVTTLRSLPSPFGGASTVTEYVTVAVAPAAMAPVQVSLG